MAPNVFNFSNRRRPLQMQPVPFPRENDQLNNAFRTLQQFNQLGVMVTWVDGDWQPWERPIRVNSRTGHGTAMSARSFSQLEDLQPPCCPHTDSSSRTMALFLGQKLTPNGPRCDFFRSVNHRCRFHVLIPLLNPPVFLTSPEDIQQYRLDQAALDAASSRTFGSPSPSSTPLGASSSNPLNPRRRWPGDVPPPVVAGKVRSLFNLRLANARRNNDAALISRVFSERRSGVYSAYPDRHPASSQEGVHTILQVYDSRIYPDCVDRVLSNQRFIDTAIGIALRELNSTLGIPEADFKALSLNMVFCSGCYCTYSIDGFNHHVQRGVCSNHPDGTAVKNRDEEDIPRTVGRTFPNGYKPPANTPDLLDTPIGLAYLEWNTRFGVPLDVWALISTAVVHCPAFAPTLAKAGEGDFAIKRYQYCLSCVLHSLRLFALTMDPIISLFDDFAVQKQRRHQNQDLVLFSRVALQCVRVAWPVVGGHSLPANFVANFLRKFDLHWPCFCVIADPELATSSLSCRIAETLDGIYASCHHSPARCRFFLDLSSIRAATELKAEYNALTVKHLGTAEYDKVMLGQFLTLDQKPEDTFDASDARYFPGYLGERECDYPGVWQLQEKALFKFTALQQSQKIVNLPSQAIVEELPRDLNNLPPGTKKSQGAQTIYFFGETARAEASPLALGEMQLLRAITRMEGLTKDDVEILLSPCPHCPLYFPARLLKSHSIEVHNGRK
ncbi:hypothetical protein B0H16DRAFT_1750512 [Mycena metata]|uniref:Uncharacterized protein n=1 Tax=Mycena metata TaxID=1033252 RepID=A0AAD7DN94_9AGAR|nr:hypothetical protein B0H16DRAFT_1750512 [Mycena metata]